MNRLIRRSGGASVILLIGSIAAALAVARVPPGGVVRADGHAVADARGPFNPLGATLFWGAWGYKFDRARLERNLATLSEAGIDYVRVLGSVGGPSWEDRTVDPRWNDYDAVVGGLTDLVYERYGMRVQWTLFGGAPFTPSGAPREALVDRFARLAKGREHKIFAFEIGNEARSNGFEGPEGTAELRRLGERLNTQTPVLVALSAPGSGDACDTYAGAGADVATIHYPRSYGDEGPLKPLRRPWSYPSAYDAKCRGQLPQLVFNNEPIGPESSVSEDEDPSRIAAAYVLTFLANNASYVLHTGPGIRGGGEADRGRGRHANFSDLASLKHVFTALRAVRRQLPPGLANWTRQDPKTAPVTLHGPGRIYTASSGERFVSVVLGADASTALQMRAPSSIEIIEPAGARQVQRRAAASGKSIALPAGEALVLVGRRSVR